MTAGLRFLCEALLRHELMTAEPGFLPDSGEYLPEEDAFFFRGKDGAERRCPLLPEVKALLAERYEEEIAACARPDSDWAERVLAGERTPRYCRCCGLALPVEAIYCRRCGTKR